MCESGGGDGGVQDVLDVVSANEDTDASKVRSATEVMSRGADSDLTASLALSMVRSA